jgi:tetratricopeptide (TPR) repeat protein
LVHPEGATFLFAHALVQEGVYSSLLKASRRELHQRAAGWFLDGDPVLHAQHLDRAEDASAARAYGIAAEAQREGFHGEQAPTLAERGLAIAADPVDRFELTCLRGALLDSLGSTVEAIAAYRVALQLAVDDATHCRAAIGLASGLRISDELGEALEALDSAQAAAMRIGSAADLARIHHLRGNIYFPQGRIDRCREEHEAGLRHARETGSPEAEARSLGGLGDAVYAQGRMRTAFEYFSRCVDLARAHGFVRIEVANRPMVGFSRYFLNQLRSALNDGRDAVEAAARVGQPRAEMLGHGMCALACFELGDRDSALAHIAQGGDIARRLGAKRFEAQYVELQGRMLHATGRREEGRQRLTEAFALCRAAGRQFTGPAVTAALALATEDPAEQSRLLDQGEELLRLGAAAHNHLWFYRDAIEAMIAGGRWQEALRYAGLLENCTRDEPLPWSAVFIDRARALAEWKNGRQDAEAQAALEAVRKTLEAAELRAYLPAVVNALAIKQSRPG